jgi:two-component system, response regulator
MTHPQGKPCYHKFKNYSNFRLHTTFMNKFRLVVADDDEDDFITISDAFKELKRIPELYRVADGQELLLYLESCSRETLPHLILLDLNMPKMDGMEALIFLKGNALWRTIPVIIYSTCSNWEQKKKCFQLGSEAFVTKGNSFKEVIEFAGGILNFLSGIQPLPGRYSSVIYSV